MSVQTLSAIPENRKNRKAYNIFSLFGSQQSYATFNRQRNKRMSVEQLRKTNQSETNNKDMSQTKSKDQKQQKQRQYEVKGQIVAKESEMPKLRCGKCMKLLLKQQNQGGLCCQCIKMWKAIENGNFSKFIRFVIAFKKNKQNSFGKISKVKRIQSIQSCQSFTLNKAESSSKHPPFKTNNSNKQSYQLKYSNTESSRFKFGKISVGSLYKQSQNENSIIKTSLGGYFCNECLVSPIEGQRFHCLKCSDFDLCQKCYFHVGHKHQMNISHQSRDEKIKKAKESALMQSQNMKKALPLLSQSIQKFQSMPKLYTSYKIKINS